MADSSREAFFQMWRSRPAASERLLEMVHCLMIDGGYSALFSSSDEFRLRFAESSAATVELLRREPIAALAGVSEREVTGRLRLIAATMLCRFWTGSVLCSLTTALTRRHESPMPCVIRRIVGYARRHQSRHIVGIQAEGRWATRSGQAFVDSQGGSGATVLRGIHLLSGSTFDTLCTEDPFEVMPMQPQDRALLEEAVLLREPLLVADALGHRGAGLLQREAIDDFRLTGLDLRGRVVLCARDGQDQPLAAAVVDCGPSHLMDLYNTVHLYPLGPGGECAYRALVDACRGYFGARGIGRFAVLAAPEDLFALRGCGLLDRGEGSVWVTHEQLFDSLVEHFDRMSIPRRRRAA